MSNLKLARSHTRVVVLRPRLLCSHHGTTESHCLDERNTIPTRSPTSALPISFPISCTQSEIHSTAPRPSAEQSLARLHLKSFASHRYHTRRLTRRDVGKEHSRHFTSGARGWHKSCFRGAEIARMAHRDLKLAVAKSSGARPRDGFPPASWRAPKESQ